MNQTKGRRRYGTELLEHHRRLATRRAPQLSRPDAEDLASEAVLRAWQNPPPDGRHAPWLERIFANLVVDRGRRRRVAERSVNQLRLDPPVATPEEACAVAERARLVEQALATLPTDLGAAVRARFYDEARERERATRGRAESATARTRVHRALARLRRALGHLRGLAIPGWSTPALTAQLGGAAMPALLTAALVFPTLPLGSSPRAFDLPAPPPAVHRLAQARATTGGHSREADAAAARVPAPAEASRDPRPSPLSSAVAGAPAKDRAARGPAPSRMHRAPDPAAEDSANSRPPVQHIDYENDEVVGTLQRPDGTEVTGDPGAVRHPSLIEIPRDFVAAVAKSLEDL